MVLPDCDSTYCEKYGLVQGAPAGAASSFRMVRVWPLGCPTMMVPLEGVPRRRRTVSLGSKVTSPTTVTVTAWVREVLLKVRLVVFST